MAVVNFGREITRDLGAAGSREWLCTNGIGGFASGTVAGLLSRRYHGLLGGALTPPVGRTLLVAKIDETAEYAGARVVLVANRWADGTVTLSLSDFTVGSIAEIFDGDAPHAPRGCPAQAWSVAEVLRAFAETA